MRLRVRRKQLAVAILTSLAVAGFSPVAFANDDLIKKDDETPSVAEAAAVAEAPTVAQAPGAPAPQSPSAEPDITLETITVTARKRAEELQSVPQAITAFSADDIERTGITGIRDVALQTTGLNFSPIFGQVVATPIIRGSAQTFGAPNVGVFLDGVYLTGKSAIDIELADLERIEVVKGPQSALYGRNTFAGAINYITKRPSFTERGQARLTAGSFGLVDGLVSYSGPISDTLAFRAAGRYAKQDGFFRSSLDGGDIDFQRNYGGTFELLWQSDRLSVLGRVFYNNEDSGQPASAVVRANGLPRVGPIIPPATGLGLNQTYVGQLPDRVRQLPVNTTRINELGDYGYREDTWRANVTIDYDFDSMLLTSITSWNRRSYDYQFDGDNTFCDRSPCPNFGPPIAAGTSRFATSSEEGSVKDWSQELRLTSQTDGPLQWLVGFYYYNTQPDALQRSLAPIGSQASFGFPSIKTPVESASLYGSLTYAFNDQWSVTVEGRGEREKQEFRQFPTQTTGVPPTSASRAVFNLDQTFSFFTPRLVLDYQFDPSTLLYANVAKGVKTGGFNTNLNLFDNQRTYDEESQLTFELGAKKSWLDDRLRTNLALYRTNWDDQQIACQNPASAFPGATSTQRTYVCNVGEAKIEGLELDALYALNENLTLQGGYSYTDARYTRFLDDSLAATLVNAGRPPFDFNDRFLPYVPRNVFFGALNAEFPVGGDVTVFGNLQTNRATRQFLRADNLAFIRARQTWNLRAGIRTGGGWTATAFVNNLTNDDAAVTGVRFFDSVNFSVPAPLVTWSQPRQFGVTLQYDF